MARTSRKNIVAGADAVREKAAPMWKTAGYIRLSIEDGGKPGADTLEGQKQLVTSFIENSSDMSLENLFCDNGCSGTDFQRPQFDRLMEAVKKGDINCIVTKDLSRFGRNYKETGNYLERIFPFLGVRFIAINDSFDTLTAERNSDGYIAVLLNIVNEMYSKDLSVKLSASFHTKQKSGQYIGASPPYGYRKCKGNINKLEPDPETAPIIKRIFDMKKSGVASLQIARTLNAEGIISPGRLHCLRTGSKNLRMQNSHWEYTRIYHILRDPVYLGHMAQGRSLQSFNDGVQKRNQKRSDWVIVENTHEPLVDMDTFQAAQARKRGVNVYSNPKPVNILKGLIFCADCGYAMPRTKTTGRYGTTNYSYGCRNCREHSNIHSSKHINEKSLFPILLDIIKKQIDVAVQMDDMVRKLNETQTHQNRKINLEQKYTQISNTLSRKKLLCDSLYQNYIEKLMTERDYLDMKRHYQEEIKSLELQLAEADAKRIAEKAISSDNLFLTTFCGFKGITELARETAVALINRVIIGENKQVDIVFRYNDEYKSLAEYVGDANA